MACFVVPALRTSCLQHFPGHKISVIHSSWYMKLSGSLVSSVLYFTKRDICLHRNSESLYVLRNPLFGLLSPPLKMHSDLCVRKTFSSKHGLIMARDTSKPQNKTIAFMDSDRCQIIDSSNDVILNISFSEAKELADKKKCRLVYMSRNRDGIYCFKLQALTDIFNTMKLSDVSQDISVQNKPKEKPQRNTAKEFRIHASIGDHDLAIKLSKMRALLQKGKDVLLIINTSANSSKDERTAAVFMKMFTEELGDVCNIKQNFTNATSTSLTLKPTSKDAPAT